MAPRLINTASALPVCRVYCQGHQVKSDIACRKKRLKGVSGDDVSCLQKNRCFTGSDPQEHQGRRYITEMLALNPINHQELRHLNVIQIAL